VSKYVLKMNAKKISVSFPVVKDMLHFIKQFVRVDNVVKDLCVRFDEQTTKKITLIFTLMPKAYNWCSKDAEIQSLVVGLIIYIYKMFEGQIKELLQYYCANLMDDAQNNVMTEQQYKSNSEILMMLNKTFEWVKDVDVESPPEGEWKVDETGLTLLSLIYELI